MEVGRDPYAVFVGGGDLNADLFAVRPDGGAATPITFSNVAEMRPALSPGGAGLAFLRGTSLNDSTPSTVWVMNLLNGAERDLELPKGAGSPRLVGWSRDERSLVVATENGLYRFNAPPAAPEPRPVAPTERAAAESSMAVLLGEPVFAWALRCGSPTDLCVVGDSGPPALLARGARDPVRWGGDSVAYFVNGQLEIRPLGPGRPRRPAWSNMPERPRQMTFFPGKRKRD